MVSHYDSRMSKDITQYVLYYQGKNSLAYSKNLLRISETVHIPTKVAKSSDPLKELPEGTYKVINVEHPYTAFSESDNFLTEIAPAVSLEHS